MGISHVRRLLVSTSAEALFALKPGDELVLHIIQEDIDTAKCQSLDHCVLANAGRRQCELPPRPRVIDVNASRILLRINGWTFRFDVPDKGAGLVKTFDKIGHEKGEAAARAALSPTRLKLTFVKKFPTPTRTEAERKARKPQTRVSRTGQKWPQKHVRSIGF